VSSSLWQNGRIHAATKVEFVPHKTSWMVARVQFMVPCGFLVLDFGLGRHSFLWPTFAGQYESLILVWTNVPHGNRHRKHFLISKHGYVARLSLDAAESAPLNSLTK